MSKLQKRRKRTANGNSNAVDLNEELTPAQVCVLAAQQGVSLNQNILALQRRDGTGTPYIKRGKGVTYTRQSAIRLIESRKPRLIEPAQHTRNR